MKRLFFTLIIALVATVGNSWAQCPSLYSGPAEATLRVDGWLSEDLFFDFDDATGTLIVASRGGSGVDAMPDFQAGFNPWFQYVRLENGMTITNDNSVGSKVEDESFRDKIKKVIIWCNVTHIGDYAFADCFNLEEVEIQNSVTSIGKGAFMGCDKLTAIVIPNSVKSIGNLAFLNCSSLADVDMGNSVETIGEWAFGYCVITSVTIPNSVTSIGESAFMNCNNLKDVTVSWNTPLSFNDGYYIFPGGDFVLHVPTGTTTAYTMANVWKFFGTITDGSTVIVNSSDFSVDGNGVLVAYKGIGGDVTIPNTVKKMSLRVFDNMIAEYGTITIPESVIEIVDNDDVSYIPYLFVEAFSVSSENTKYSSENGVLYDIDKKVLVKYPNLSANTTYILPNSVEEFHYGAFASECINLEYMVISCMLDELPIGCSFRVGKFKALEITGDTRVSPIDICLIPSGGCGTVHNRILIVPAGMKAAYKASSNWNCAGNIVERVEIEPGFAKIGRMANPDEYLGQSNAVASGPNMLFMANMLIYANANVNFYVYEVSSSQYVMALDAMKIGDYIKGKYVFNPKASGLADLNKYMTNSKYGLSQINAVRKGNVLYILGDEVVTEADDIEDLISEGTISGINLSTDKNFVFSFVPVGIGSTGFFIKSEASSSPDEYVSTYNGVAVLSDYSPEVFKYEKTAGSLDVAQLSVSAASLSLDAGSGSKTFDITSSNVAWTVSSSAAWATVNPVSGSGNATVSVSATANTATSPRTATITITGGDITKTVTVTQAKAGDTPVAPTLDVSVTTLDFGAESGSKTVNVTSNVAWSVSSTEQWATTSLIYGSGNATITVYALENTTNSSRTATITVTSGSLTKTIKVTQAKAGGSNNNNNDEPATPPTTPTTPITPPQDDPTDIIATPSQPSGNKGEVGLSLNIPSDKSMTGEFTVTMPVGFNLDKSKTTLAQELQSGHSLEISDKATGVWSFQIKSKVSARSASDATYRKIVDIAYTIEDNTAIGNYKITISDLNFVMEDNTKIEEDDLNVSIPYTSVGNDFMEGAVKVSYYNNTLSVSSPYSERIEVYSITGVQIFNQQKAEGEVKYNIENLPAGIIIVKGSSGWVEKILVR